MQPMISSFEITIGTKNFLTLFTKIRQKILMLKATLRQTSVMSHINTVDLFSNALNNVLRLWYIHFKYFFTTGSVRALSWWYWNRLFFGQNWINHLLCKKRINHQLFKTSSFISYFLIATQQLLEVFSSH